MTLNNEWKKRHQDAELNPSHLEGSILNILKGAEQYAEEHKRRFEDSIGNDGVLGQGLEEILTGLRTLLNGELGRLDGGTLDGRICKLAERAEIEGF